MAKWQRWGRGVRRHSYKALCQLFHNRGFLGNRSRDLYLSEFFDAAYGLLPGLLLNRGPCCLFIATIGYHSPNHRRLLRHLIRLSKRYCTAVTPVFSPRLDFSDIFDCCLGTDYLLDWFSTIFLFLTLAPRDCVTYY